MTNDGNSGRKYQVFDCAATISDVDIDPAYMNTETNDRPIATS